MLSDEQKLKLVDEIFNSPEFKESKRYQDLLLYLVKETLAGNSPKEITIGMQFFERGNDFDPKEDTTVRVYINNLRKKLEHYYLTTTTPLTHKVIIPRGHYTVQYIEVKSKEEPGEKSHTGMHALSFLSISLYLFVFLAGGLLSWTLFVKNTKPIVPGTGIWKEFTGLTSRPTLIVLGDFTFLYERASGGNSRFARDMRVNTTDDYKKLVKADPKFAEQYVISDFTYLRPSASWGLQSILPALQQSATKYSLKLATQFTLEDLKSNNVIFLGSFKSLHAVEKLLHVFNIQFTLNPPVVKISSNDSVLSFTAQNLKGGNYERDYAVIVKGTGPEGSTVMLLIGFADTGVIEAARIAANPHQLDSLPNAFDLKSAAPFTLVIETEGVNQSIFKNQIKYIGYR